MTTRSSTGEVRQEAAFKAIVGGHIRLDGSDATDVPDDVMFQCFLTNSHGHFAESRVTAWRDFVAARGKKFDSSSIHRIAHASYVTFPWAASEETHEKSVKDVFYASRCVNILGLWGLNVHLPKEYHLSVDFGKRVAECLEACEPPCILLFEIVGNSTGYVSEGKLPPLPIDRMRECQAVIEKTAVKMHREKDWGFCFDTAHAFVQGQPLTTANDARRFIEETHASSSRGPVNIQAVHFNGSLHPFKSGRDQHTQAGDATDCIWGSDDSGITPLLRWIIENKIATVLERPGNSTVEQYDEEMKKLMAMIGKRSV